MNLKIYIVAITLVCFACSNDKKSSEPSKQISTLRSDILLENTTSKPFSRPNKNDQVSLTISGKTILQGIATFKAVDESGVELYCETFPSKALIQPEYKTANSTLQEAHIREVVEGFFVAEEGVFSSPSLSLAGI